MDNPLVLVHGAGDNAGSWREQVAYFGARAYALDLPGHGARADTLSARAGVDVGDYARAVLDSITTELQLVRPIVVGHSLGGLVALQLGLDHAEQLGGLVLIGAGARLRVLPALLESARVDPVQARITLTRLAVSPGCDPALLARLLAEAEAEQNPVQSGVFYRDLLACDTFDVMDRLAELQNLPTLILCGAEERSAPVKYSVYLHEHIAGSTLHIIPDAGHYVQREQPLEVNRAIAAWLVSG